MFLCVPFGGFPESPVRTGPAFLKKVEDRERLFRRRISRKAA